MILTKKKFVKLEKAISKIKKNKLVIHCPKCDRLLRGATQEMIGDIGVCPKCKAEFEIKQKKEIEWDM